MTVTGATAPDRVSRRRWAILGVLCISLLVIGLDNTILNVALPSLVHDLHATESQLQWIVDSYTIVFAALLLTTGSLGDRFGRRGTLALGLVLFGAGSVMSAFAGSATVLIGTRAFQGLGGAFIMPSTLSILTNVFTDDRERGRAIGIWAGVSGLGVGLGPIVGGWLLEHFWWGSVFLVNVPVVAVGLVGCYALVPTSKDPHAPKLDPLGTLLSITALTALLFAIIEAPSRGWTSPLILAAFSIGAVLLVAFIVWELRCDHPMLDVSFFRNPRFSAASVAVTLVFFAMFGSLFFLTQYLQFVLGYDALQAGVRIMPIAVALMVAAPLSSTLVSRFGTKLVVTAGLTIVAGALALLSRATPTTGYELVAVVLLLLGIGMGTAMAPATDSIMGSLPLEQAGVGSAVNDTTRQVGGALGVAILGSIMSTAYRARIDSVPALARLPGPALEAVRNGVGQAAAVADAIANQLHRPDLAAQLTRLANDAFIHGMTQTVVVGAVVALLGALVALVFLPARPVADAGVSADLGPLVVGAARKLRGPPAERDVLGATFDLLAEAGFSSLNFHAVSTRAGVSTANIERHWTSRVDLVVSTVAALMAASPVPDTGDLRRDCAAYLRDSADRLSDPRTARAVAELVGQAARSPELAAALRARVLLPRRAEVVRMLERDLGRDHDGGGPDPETLADLLVSPLYYRVLVSGQPVDGRILAGITDALVAAATPSAARPR